MQKVKGEKVTQKDKIVKRKFCIKKTHVYNNCYELRSRAIQKSDKIGQAKNAYKDHLKGLL